MKARRLDTNEEEMPIPSKHIKVADKDGSRPAKSAQRSSLGLQTLSDFESFQKAHADKLSGGIQPRRRRLFKEEPEQLANESDGSNQIRKFDEEGLNRGFEGLSDSNSLKEELQIKQSTKKSNLSRPEQAYLDWKSLGYKNLGLLDPVAIRPSDLQLKPKAEGAINEKIKSPTVVYEAVATAAKGAFGGSVSKLGISTSRQEILLSLIEQFLAFRTQRVNTATNATLEDEEFNRTVKDHHLNVYNRNRELALHQVDDLVTSLEESLDKAYATIRNQFVPEITSHLEQTAPRLKNYEPDFTFEEVTRGICASHRQNLHDQLKNVNEYSTAKEQRVKEMLKTIKEAHAQLDTKEKKKAEALSKGLNWTGGNTDPLKDLYKIAKSPLLSNPELGFETSGILDNYYEALQPGVNR